MQANYLSIRSFLNRLIFIILLSFSLSCGSNEEKIMHPEPLPKDSKDTPIFNEPKPSYSIEPPSDYIASIPMDFKVVLSVDSVMYLGQSGMMQVWIGEDNIEVSFSKGMSQDEKKIPSTIGRYAKITPFAPDFEVKSLSSTICYKIDPSGSEIRYSLIPKDEGTYKVSADIELYETENCTGISIPKTARALSVSVGVDMNKEISKGIHKMEEVIWDKFMIFWIALITLLFGTAIFIIKRFIKKKTGYGEEAGNS